MDSTSVSLLLRVRQAEDETSWQRFVDLYTPMIYKWARKIGLPSDVSAQLSATLTALLKKNPEARPQSAAQVVALLNATDDAPMNHFRKKVFTGIIAAAAIVFLLSVLITINYKDGTSTSIVVSNSKQPLPQINIDADNPDIESISISDNAEQPAQASQSDNVDAALLDWLFEVGATVRMRDSSSASRWVVSRQGVSPKDRLITISFSGTGIQDKDLARIRNVKTLEGLYLLEATLTSQSLNYLSDLPGLEFLHTNMPFTVEVASAITTLPTLKTLEIDSSPQVESGAIGKLATAKELNSLLMGGPDLTSEKAKEVGALRNLIFLGIRNSPSVQEDAFRVIAELPRLNKFAIMEAANVTVEMAEALKDSAFFIFCIAEKTQINADAVPVLAQLARLTRLEFYITGVSPEVVEEVKKLKKLSELAIHRCNVSHLQIEDLKRALPGVIVTTDVVPPPPSRPSDAVAADWLRQVGGEFMIRTPHGQTVDGVRTDFGDYEITKISLNVKELKGEELEHIAKLRGLIELNLTGDVISEAGCEHISNIQSLRFLNLREATVDEKSAQYIATLPALERIGLRSVNLDAAAMEALAEAPKLMGMTLAELSIKDEAVAPLSNLENLRELGITDCAELTSDSLRHVRRIEGLRDLYLIRLPGVRNAGLSYLNGHSNLHRLGFLDVPIDDEAFQDSLSFPRLFWISFENTEVSSVGIDRLTRLTMPTLEQLQLGSLEVANDCLRPASAWSQLRNLGLTNATLDAEQLRQLSTLKKLNELRLVHVTINEIDKETLRQALPNCEIRFD